MIIRTSNKGYVGTRADLEALTSWCKAYLIDTYGPVEGSQRFKTLAFTEAISLWETHGEGRTQPTRGDT